MTAFVPQGCGVRAITDKWEVHLLRVSGIAAVMVAALSLAGPAAAQSGGGCQLNGTASFSPGLNSSDQPFTYSFGGNLSGCQSSDATAPPTGTVSAGQVA